jgi:hypothetical protein
LTSTALHLKKRRIRIVKKAHTLLYYKYANQCPYLISFSSHEFVPISRPDGQKQSWNNNETLFWFTRKHDIIAYIKNESLASVTKVKQKHYVIQHLIEHFTIMLFLLPPLRQEVF